MIKESEIKVDVIRNSRGPVSMTLTHLPTGTVVSRTFSAEEQATVSDRRVRRELRQELAVKLIVAMWVFADDRWVQVYRRPTLSTRAYGTCRCGDTVHCRECAERLGVARR